MFEGFRFSMVGKKFYYWARALKFGIIFQKYALKVLNFWKNRENSRKMQSFQTRFSFSCGTMGNIRNIISLGNNGGLGGSPDGRNL